MFLAGAALTACSLLPSETPEVDPCAVEITRLEGLRNIEIAAECAGKAFDECPAVTGINAKYDPLIQEQVRCGADR
jgi:hypothetical protein